jgi:hypothetical protein
VSYTVAAAIKAAKGEIGYRERGENDTKYNHWLGRIGGYAEGGYGYPWCASFQAWCADQAGGEANRDYPKTAGCVAAVSWFKGMQRWSGSPHVGDWVFYGPGGGTHVELVVGLSASSITTIGGNTSGSLSGRYYAGDGVYLKTVSRDSDRIYGYGRPKYEEDDMPLSKDDVEKVAAETVRQMFHAHYNRRGDTLGTALEVAKDGVTALLARTPDVDEEAVAAAVLASLTPEAIAAAIPENLGGQVAEALAARLASTPDQAS